MIYRQNQLYYNDFFFLLNNKTTHPVGSYSQQLINDPLSGGKKVNITCSKCHVKILLYVQLSPERAWKKKSKFIGD